MRMGKLSGFLVAGGLFLLAQSAVAADHEMLFLTEEFPPLSGLDEAGEPAGQAVDLVRALMEDTGTAGDIQVLEWSQAYRAALESDQAVLFSTALTAERREQFQWVGPTAVLHTSLYALADHPITIHTLDQARSAQSIATVTDYYSDELLAAEGGFDNVIRFADEADAARALLDGRVELMVAGNTSLPAVLGRLGADMTDLQRVFAVSTDLTYLAFSPQIPETVVQRWQHALDEMKTDGRFAAMYQEWLPAEAPPGRMYLVTEEYPPITFMQEGRPGGFVTDIVRQIVADLELEDRVHLTSWNNAYNMALLHPNVALFSAERTDERESLFHWVGPVGRNSAILYGRSGTELQIDSLNDARQVGALATTTNWFTEQYLQRQDFDNLRSSPDPADSVRRLMNAEVDLAIFTDLTVSEIVAAAGYSMDDLQPLYVVSETDFYIALSGQTDPEVVAQWQSALETLKADGRFERIYRSYLPEVDVSGLLDNRNGHGKL